MRGWSFDPIHTRTKRTRGVWREFPTGKLLILNTDNHDFTTSYRTHEHSRLTASTVVELSHSYAAMVIETTIYFFQFPFELLVWEHSILIGQWSVIGGSRRLRLCWRICVFCQPHDENRDYQQYQYRHILKSIQYIDGG